MQIGQFGLFKVTNFVTLKQAKIFFGILFSDLHVSNLSTRYYMYAHYHLS